MEVANAVGVPDAEDFCSGEEKMASASFDQTMEAFPMWH
jgi:hypothetical protein